MEAERRRRVEEVYHGAAGLAGEERAAFLAGACGGDEWLRSEVESLLERERNAGSFTESPAVEGAKAGARLIPGRVVSHYRVIEKIGCGGMGVVYKAEDTRLHRLVALKFLPEGHSRDEQALARFRREALAASALDHPNICMVYEVGEHEGEPFLAMQYLEGRTLGDRIGGKALGMGEILELGIEIAEALSAAHGRGIIHRDLKPANVFVTQGGHARVLDFGLAKRAPARLGSAVGTVTVSDEGLATQPGTAVGTAAYMSPEQVRGEELDARTDLFSFGAVLYEMATGVRAFRGESSGVVFEAILNRAPAALGRLNPEAPPELERIAGKALEKDRRLRYQHAEEIATDLRRLRRDLERAPSVGRETAARARRLWRVWVGAGAGAAVLAVGIGWYRWRAPGGEMAAEPVARQLTFNPPEDGVFDAAISPDGENVAYNDAKGLFIRSRSTGETRPVPLPAGFGSEFIVDMSWFPDGGKLLVSRVDLDSEISSLWEVPVLGQAAPRMLRPDARHAAISPDGKSMVFVSGSWCPGCELWVSRISGEVPVKLASGEKESYPTEPLWSPSGRWIADVRVTPVGASVETSIEIRSPAGGPSRTLASAEGLGGLKLLPAFAWLPDGQLVFAAEDWSAPSPEAHMGLWEIRVDPNTGVALSRPKRLVETGDFFPYSLSATPDGKMLAFLKSRVSLVDVYLGELEPGGRLKRFHRFTLDTHISWPEAWMPGKRSLLFDSNRNGRFELFEQGLDDVVPSVVARNEKGDIGTGDAISPDGAWILYWVNYPPPAGGREGTSALMRQPVAGGPAETVLSRPRWDSNVMCPVRDARPCVLSTQDGGVQVFHSLDPVKGEGEFLGKVPIDWGGNAEAALAPDGSRIAVVDNSHRDRIDVLDVGDRKWREIQVRAGWKIVGMILAWTADGSGFFMTAYGPSSEDLVHVTLDGRVKLLLRNPLRRWMDELRPSPDGKYLALSARTLDSNVWLLENPEAGGRR